MGDKVFYKVIRILYCKKPALTVIVFREGQLRCSPDRVFIRRLSGDLNDGDIRGHSIQNTGYCNKDGIAVFFQVLAEQLSLFAEGCCLVCAEGCVSASAAEYILVYVADLTCRDDAEGERDCDQDRGASAGALIVSGGFCILAVKIQKRLKQLRKLKDPEDQERDGDSVHEPLSYIQRRPHHAGNERCGKKYA